MFNKLIGVILIIAAFIVEGMWLSFTFGTVVVGILLLIFAPAILLVPFNILFGMGIAFMAQGTTQQRQYYSQDNRYEKEHSQTYDEMNPLNKVDQYYEVLGCTKLDDFATIKKNYKKLSKKFHPDAVEGKGLDDEFVAFATQRMQEINEAYGYIKQSKGL